MITSRHNTTSSESSSTNAWPADYRQQVISDGRTWQRHGGHRQTPTDRPGDSLRRHTLTHGGNEKHEERAPINVQLEKSHGADRRPHRSERRSHAQRAGVRGHSLYLFHRITSHPLVVMQESCSSDDAVKSSNPDYRLRLCAQQIRDAKRDFAPSQMDTQTH